MAFLEFLGSHKGRAARIAAGAGLVATGLAGGRGRRPLAVAGLVPLTAGLFDVCLLGPIFRRPLAGRSFREAAASR